MNKLAYEKCPACGMPKLSCRATPACYRAAKKAQAGDTTRLGQWGIIYGMPQEIQKTVNDLESAAVRDAEGIQLFPIELVNRLSDLAESLGRNLTYRN